MKVYIVQSGTYDDSEILKVTTNKESACEFAKSQGKEIEFCYGQEHTNNQIMRVRFKDDEMTDYIVEEYELEENK